ncbi:MAG: hypothetical protein ACR2MY_05030 [Candidatus Dormibacteria bacterium]
MLRIALALTVPAASYSHYDLQSFAAVAAALRHNWLHLYQVGLRWPYPPGYLPWIAVSARLGKGSVTIFELLIRLPAMLADSALALVVAWHLAAEGVSGGRTVAAAMLVAFGPCFFVISGIHGQIDAVAILPAVAAVLLWQRGGHAQRAVVCGLLIGLAASVKTVPIAMVFALLPSARSLREAVVLVVCAVGLPALLIAPFVLTNPTTTLYYLGYLGTPGLGGLSLALQPELAQVWLQYRPHTYSPATAFTVAHATLISRGVLLGAGGYVYLRRLSPLGAAVLIWLAVYALVPNFFFQYLIWGLPFFLLANHVGKVLAVQVVAVIPLLLAEFRPWADGRVLLAFVPLMLVLWALFVVALVTQLRRPARAVSVA